MIFARHGKIIILIEGTTYGASLGETNKEVRAASASETASRPMLGGKNNKEKREMCDLASDFFYVDRVRGDLIKIELRFPNGLAQFVRDGSRVKRTAVFEVIYRDVWRDPDWRQIVIHFTANSTAVLNEKAHIQIDRPGVYQVGIRHLNKSTEINVVDTVELVSVTGSLADCPVEDSEIEHEEFGPVFVPKDDICVIVPTKKFENIKGVTVALEPRPEFSATEVEIGKKDPVEGIAIRLLDKDGNPANGVISGVFFGDTKKSKVQC